MKLQSPGQAEQPAEDRARHGAAPLPPCQHSVQGPNGEGMVTSGVEGHQSERETLFYQQLTVARILLLNTLFFRGGGLIKKKRRGNKNLRRRSSKGLF